MPAPFVLALERLRRGGLKRPRYIIHSTSVGSMRDDKRIASGGLQFNRNTVSQVFCRRVVGFELGSRREELPLAVLRHTYHDVRGAVNRKVTNS